MPCGRVSSVAGRSTGYCSLALALALFTSLPGAWAWVRQPSSGRVAVLTSSASTLSLGTGVALLGLIAILAGLVAARCPSSHPGRLGAVAAVFTALTQMVLGVAILALPSSMVGWVLAICHVRILVNFLLLALLAFTLNRLVGHYEPKSSTRPFLVAYVAGILLVLLAVCSVRVVATMSETELVGSSYSPIAMILLGPSDYPRQFVLLAAAVWGLGFWARGTGAARPFSCLAGIVVLLQIGGGLLQATEEADRWALLVHWVLLEVLWASLIVVGLLLLQPSGWRAEMNGGSQCESKVP